MTLILQLRKLSPQAPFQIPQPVSWNIVPGLPDSEPGLDSWAPGLSPVPSRLYLHVVFFAVPNPPSLQPLVEF